MQDLAPPAAAAPRSLTKLAWGPSMPQRIGEQPRNLQQLHQSGITLDLANTAAIPPCTQALAQPALPNGPSH